MSDIVAACGPEWNEEEIDVFFYSHQDFFENVRRRVVSEFWRFVLILLFLHHQLVFVTLWS